MSALPTSLVGDAHPYTRERVSWRLDAGEEAYEEVSPESRPSWKLFHYISGGGLSFGRTVGQELASRRQTRFLKIAGVLAALWLAFYLWG